jgi:hypothetical protein
VNCHLFVLRDNVGDAIQLSELHNIDNLAEGVIEALGRVGVGELGEMGNAITKLNTGMGYVINLMGEIDKDHRGATTYALSKANKMSH